MKLKELINEIPRGEKIRFKMRIASELDVGVSSIDHWCNGTRKPSGKHVLKLEPLITEAIEQYKLSGAVTRYDLRPDLYPRD